MNIANGTYRARPKSASVYESPKSGALVLALVHELDGGGEIKSYHTLALADGEIRPREIESLKKWSGWDGSDPYWFMDTGLTGLEVELVVENEPGFNDPTKVFPKVKWVNPCGGGNGGGLPEAADRRAVLAKYGSKFRAVAGGVPLAARAPAKPAAQAAPPAPARRNLVAPALPPQPAARKAAATQTGAWNRLNELAGAMRREEIEAAWFECVDGTGMDQSDMTAEGWAQVTAAIERRFAGKGGAGGAESGAGGGGEGAGGDEAMPF